MLSSFMIWKSITGSFNSAVAEKLFKAEQYNFCRDDFSFRYLHLRMENFIWLDLNWQQESDAMHRYYEEKNQILEPLNI